jgi:hypothetical protein
MMRRTLPALALALAACATADVTDSDTLERTAAYVSVLPTASVGAIEMERIDLTLSCTELGGTHYEAYLPKLATRRATIVKLRPGTCYVSQVKGLLSTQGSLEPAETLFATRPSQLNFPGVWSFRFRLTHGLSVALPTQMSTTLDFALKVTEQNAAVARTIIGRQFPNIMERLPLEYTRIVESPR